MVLWCPSFLWESWWVPGCHCFSWWILINSFRLLSCLHWHRRWYADYLNDLSVPHITGSKYWDGYFTLNDPTLHILAQSVLNECSKYNINVGEIQKAMYPICPHINKQSLINYESKLPYFGWLPNETVKCTFQNCTQHLRMPPSTYLQKCFKSPSPGANIFHHQKVDAIDIIFSDTPAVFGDETQAHIFVGAWPTSSRPRCIILYVSLVLLKIMSASWSS